MRSVILVLAVGLMSFACLAQLNVISAVSSNLVKAGTSQQDISTFQSLVCFASSGALIIVGFFARRVAWPVIGVACTSLLFLASVLLACTDPGGIPFLMSRVIFGVGFAVIFVVQDSVLSRWFADRGMTAAFTVVLVLDRLAELLTFNIGAFLAEHDGFTRAFEVTAFVSFLGLLASITVLLLAERSAPEDSPKTLMDLVRSHDARFWLLVAVTTLVYSAYFAFLVQGTNFLAKYYSLAPAVPDHRDNLLQFPSAVVKSAPGILTIIHILALALSFPVMVLVKRRGYRGELMLCGCVLLFLAFQAFRVPGWHPAVPISLFGVGLVLITVPLWPAVYILSPDPSAYVLVTVPQYLGMASFAWFSGWLYTATGSFESGLFVSACLAAGATVATAILLRLDARRGGILRKPELATPTGLKPFLKSGTG